MHYVNQQNFSVMNNKQLLKVKKVSEERYFRSDGELIRFIEKQGGMTWQTMCDMYRNLSTLHQKPKVAERFWKTNMNLSSEILVIGAFLFLIFRGCYVRTSGDYAINILAEQRISNLTGNDINKLFNIS